MDSKQPQFPQPISPVEKKEKIKLHILIADDGETNRSLYKDMLEHLGHTVEVVNDGDALLDRLFSDGEEVDLVFSDNTMPGRTGLEVLQEIRSNSRLKKLPFILNTTDEEGYIEKDVELMDGVFVPKVSSMKAMSDAIKKAKEVAEKIEV